MLAQLERLEPTFDLSDATLISDEVEREITVLLRAKAPELSAKNSFRIAAGLVDAAAMTIATLRDRVAALQAERDKLSTQEADWESLLVKWRDMAAGLKGQIRELETKLASANQRAIQAEIRAQNAEEEMANSQQGTFDLCDKVIAAFGVQAAPGVVGADLQDAAGTC